MRWTRNTSHGNELTEVEMDFDEAASQFLQGVRAGGESRRGLTEGALKVAVHRMRKRFRELVREEIARTLDAPEDIDAEMRHLVEALSVAI